MCEEGPGRPLVACVCWAMWPDVSFIAVGRPSGRAPASGCALIAVRTLLVLGAELTVQGVTRCVRLALRAMRLL